MSKRLFAIAGVAILILIVACTGDTTCASGYETCDAVCVDTKIDPKNCGGCGTVCPTATPNCVKGTCDLPDCKGALVKPARCEGVCVDLHSDENNCGECGNVCSGKSCFAGECQQ